MNRRKILEDLLKAHPGYQCSMLNRSIPKVPGHYITFQVVLGNPVRMLEGVSMDLHHQQPVSGDLIYLFKPDLRVRKCLCGAVELDQDKQMEKDFLCRRCLLTGHRIGMEAMIQ